jgi:hypothetical protein
MLYTARAVRGLQVLSHFGGEYERRSDGSVLGNVRHPDGTLTPENYYEFAQACADRLVHRVRLCHPLPPPPGGLPARVCRSRVVNSACQ